METTTGKRLSTEVLNDRRRRAVKLRLGGMKLAEVAQAVGLARGTIISAMKAYEAGGWKAVAIKARGRSVGDGRTLNAEQEKTIRAMVCDRTPDQLKLPYALWTRSAVGELIHQQLGIKLPVRTVGHYLKRWGFTPQKPIRRAYEQRPAAVKKWLEEEYPAIAQRAKAEGAEIHWGDETGLRSDDVRGRSYAPKGQTPVVEVCSNRESFSLISSVTNQGKVRWMVFGGALNAKILIRFLKRLIQSAQRKVFLILDNLRVHHAKVVREWLAKQVEHLEVFYLPSYSPELNPDECLNADLKKAVTSKAPARSKGQLKKATVAHLRKLSKSPERIKSYFGHQPVRYAA
ncbi:MAG TPA: IS630 family transposase [Thermoanaerobaculia bacterium]|jgi:transposase|nr:IS630 family transposase [Thermoanaerobaculia bacterium]